LTPEGDTTDLARIAAQTVRVLDHHRAPPGEDELARRRKANLSPAQEENLLRWGYPYVMEEFRFHLTLTGRLPRAQAEATMAALAPVLEPLAPRPFRMDALCLFGEDEAGRFHLLHRYALTG
ncbi:MAG: phosphonate metabolism protein, partial [Pelagibaca sp.]|nr:phosphonate metabolism protein [Pelagibaca sp.]